MGQKNNYTPIKMLILIGMILIIPTGSAILENSSLAISPTSGIQSKEMIAIDPISPHCVNESFNVTGTTNLPLGTELSILVYRGSFNPGIPPQKDPWYDHLENKTFVTSDKNRGNSWVYILNTTGSYPDEYLFYAKLSDNETIQNVTIFNLISPCISGTTPDEIVTTVPSSQSTVVTTNSPTPDNPTPKPAPISASLAIIAIGCPGLIIVLKRKENK